MNRWSPLGALAGAALLGACFFACQWGENGLTRLEALNAPSETGAPEGGAPANGAGCALAGRHVGRELRGPEHELSGAHQRPVGGASRAVREHQPARAAGVEPDHHRSLPRPALQRRDVARAHVLRGGELADASVTGQPQTLGANTIPPLLVNALSTAPLAVPLPGNGTIQASGVVWLWGLRNLANPATDPLPTSADAGTVWDEDMDGHPGVTVDVVSPRARSTW